MDDYTIPLRVATQGLRFDTCSFLPHFAPTGTFVALFLAVSMRTPLAVVCVDCEPVALLGCLRLFLLILFLLTLGCHWNPPY